MIVIRLQRTGRENLATYRIVAAEKARPVKGKFLEILGHYLPAQKTPTLKYDAERITHWVSKGAIPSDTVARLLHKNGVKGMDKYMLRYTKRRPKGEEPPAPAAAAPAAAAEAPAPAGDNAAQA
jgi:small subunit ribosomal protein S16